MNVKELAAIVAEKGEVKVDVAETVIRATIEAIIETCKNTDEEIRFNGFGIFSGKTIPSRKMTNPLTGKKITTKEKRKLNFRLSNTVKDM
jgi:nucleoid DNA-binding protein